jgi:hypothetical protein
MNGAVFSLALYGGTLYAGGNFGVAGGNPANFVAKWNGSSWSALGSGVGGLVSAMALDGSGNLYAGGAFSTAGEGNASNLAKWDGSSWSALGRGTNGQVRALAVDGSGSLCVGGWFSSAGGSTWSPLGSGMNGAVAGLAADRNGNLYAGGNFTIAAGTSVRFITKEVFSVPISGNAGAPGTTLSYTDGVQKTAIADARGNYSLRVPYGWSGTVTPTRSCFAFSRTYRSYSRIETAQTGQDYSATAVTCYLVNLPLVMR